MNFKKIEKQRLLGIFIVLCVHSTSEAKVTDLGILAARSSTSSQSATVNVDGDFSGPENDSVAGWSTSLGTSSADATNSITKKVISERSISGSVGLDTQFENRVSIGASIKGSNNNEEKIQSTGTQISLGHSLKGLTEDDTTWTWKNKLSISRNSFSQNQSSGAKFDTDLRQSSVGVSSKIKFQSLFSARLAYKAMTYDQTLATLATRVTANETATSTTDGYLTTITSFSKSDTTLEVSFFPQDTIEVLLSATQSPSAYDSTTSNLFGAQAYWQIQDSLEISLAYSRTTSSGSGAATTTTELGLSKSFD